MTAPHLSPNRSLAWARDSLNTAMSAADAHGRIQYAHAAKDYAAEAVLDPGSTPEEKAAARDILVKALAITGELANFSPSRQAEIPGQTQGLDIA